MKKKFIIAANWKMNPETQAQAKKLFTTYKKLAKKYTGIHFIVAAPSPFLSVLGSSKTTPDNLWLSAENIYIHDSGSYTGAVSIPMIKDVGAQATLIGHSERRNLFGVSDDLISNKITQSILHKLPMTVCFGESQRDESGHYIEELQNQLRFITKPFTTSSSVKLLTLAYEPVWAIGKDAKRPITEDELFSTILLIKNILKEQLGEQAAKKIKILYGGSVNADNAHTLATTPGVDGFLIGRAGLNAQSITAITNSI